MTGPTVLLASHDGDGLGHARRNARLAAALLARTPSATVVLATGLASRHSWLEDPRMRVVRLPGLTKGPDGARASRDGRRVEEVLADRRAAFTALVEQTRPDLVVVDRHPYGVDGEWRPGLDRARRAGAAVVLGLRDVLDAPGRMRAELAGPGWRDVAALVDRVVVYGHRHLCDHVAEYALPLTPEYVGVVTAPPHPRVRRTRDLVVCAGGGRDGADVTRLGVAVSRHRPVVVVAGPQAGALGALDAPGLRVVRGRDVAVTPGPAGTLQMAGYNSTWEAVAAGVRPLLVPRRVPRREQAIRAARLAALGLADVVDEAADVAEVEWLLARDRTLPAEQVAAAGVRLDGADVAAGTMLALLDSRTGVVA